MIHIVHTNHGLYITFFSPQLVGLTTFGQILTLSIQDIQRLAKLSQGEVTGVKTAIAQQVVCHPNITGMCFSLSSSGFSF